MRRSYTVSWNSVSNAANYQLLEANNPVFSNSAAYYPAGTFVRIGPRATGTYRYKVRANVPNNHTNHYGSFSAPISVSVVNHVPIGQAQSVTVIKNTATPIFLGANDEDGDAMTYSVATAPAHGSLTGAPPNLIYRPSTNFVGSDSFRFQARDAKGKGDFTTVWITVSDSIDVVRILGTRDHSDAEFKHDNFSADFSLKTDPVSNFPRELNTTWFPAVYIHSDLTMAQADRGLTVSLIPAWNNGAGVMYVAIDVWIGNQWIKVGSTPCNMQDPGYIYVHPCFLKPGMNDIRLAASNGTAGTTAITWDRIEFTRQSQETCWAFGVNDGSSWEFQQSNFNTRVNADTAHSADFPKVINSWYTAQYIDFTLTQTGCQRSYELNFDVSWNNGNGALLVAVQRLDGAQWRQIGATWLGKDHPGVVEIPADKLIQGVNHWRLKALSGSNGTTSITWDRIALMRRTGQPAVLKTMMMNVLDTSLNYFLNSYAVHHDGFPLTALKVTDRARYGYSNPTEWGLAIEAWIAAAEIGKITRSNTAVRIATSLNTMLSLQANTNQFKRGLFYPYYTVVNPNGFDIASPAHDSYHELPSGDCALLWGSLNVAQGWLLYNGYTSIVYKASRVKSAMNFRSCYRKSGLKADIAMLVNADTGVRSVSAWNNWADEGGTVNMISYLSGSTSLSEFDLILAGQNRPSRTWNGVTTRESAWFNAAFTWPQRTILGVPMFGDARQRRYGLYSFIPAARGHFMYADYWNLDYVGFSDAMTQTWQSRSLVGRYVLPNIPNYVDRTPPSHIQPHGLFVWFGALDVLEDSFIERAFKNAVLLKNDINGYWHPSYSQDPYGFEVVASPYTNAPGYHGADEGRYIFETLSQSYIVLPMFEGLMRLTGGKTLTFYANKVPGHLAKMNMLIQHAYP